MTEGLAHPRNAVVLAQIKAAIRVGVRPSVFRHEWPRSDQVAVLALMAHEDAERARVHEPCGQPIDPCESDRWAAAERRLSLESLSLGGHLRHRGPSQPSRR